LSQSESPAHCLIRLKMAVSNSYTWETKNSKAKKTKNHS